MQPETPKDEPILQTRWAVAIKWGRSCFHRAYFIFDELDTLFAHFRFPAQSKVETQDEGAGENIGNNTVLLFKHKKKT